MKKPERNKKTKPQTECGKMVYSLLNCQQTTKPLTENKPAFSSNKKHNEEERQLQPINHIITASPSHTML